MSSVDSNPAQSAFSNACSQNKFSITLLSMQIKDTVPMDHRHLRLASRRISPGCRIRAVALSGERATIIGISSPCPPDASDMRGQKFSPR